MATKVFLILLISWSQIALAQLSNGLVAYYPFNGNAHDESGNGNHGTVNGPTLTTDRFGRANGAYRFDGEDDYIQVPNSPSLQFPGQLAISVWINFLPGGIDNPRILSKGYSGGFELFTEGTGSTRKVGLTKPGVNHLSSTSITAKRWQHILWNYDGNSSLLYINGVLDAVVPFLPDNSSLDMIIGRNTNLATQDNFTGQIDDIRVYARSLSEEEVLALYQEGTSESLAQQPIVFSSDVSGVYQLCTINADGSNFTTLTNFISTSITIAHPCFSPDGKKIAFWLFDGSGQDVWLIDRDGSNLRRLTFNNNAYVGERVAFSVTSDTIFYRRTTGPGAASIWMVKINGEENQLFYDFPGNELGIELVDNSYFIYFVFGGGIYHTNSKTDLSSTLLISGGQYPSHSKFVDKIAYQDYSAGNGILKIANLDGSSPQLLMNEGSNWVHDPSFNINGQFIVYGSGAEIKIVKSDGSMSNTIISGYNPHCSPTLEFTDDAPPVITGLPAEIIVRTDSNKCSAIVSWSPPSVTDNIGVDTVFSSYQPETEFPLGTTQVMYTATDLSGNSSQVSFNVTVLNNAPIINNISISETPFEVNTPITLTIDYTDVNAQNMFVNWDDGTNSTYSTPIPLIINHTYETPGLYTITVVLTDACGESTSKELEYVVVYDRHGAFVTGIGVAKSPLGSYSSNPSACGPISFAFFAKYQNWFENPVGSTAFRFSDGNLNFVSTSYQWLAVSGHKAQLKGKGKINGIGNYTFFATAIDGDKIGLHEEDKFRIKITSGSLVIYDNQFGQPEDSEAASNLIIGSIVITEPFNFHSLNYSEARISSSNNNPNQEVTVYPNPFNKEISFNFSGDEKANITVLLIDQYGQLKWKGYLPASEKGTYSIQFENEGLELSDGLYVLSISQGSATIQTKIWHSSK